MRNGVEPLKDREENDPGGAQQNSRRKRIRRLNLLLLNQGNHQMKLRSFALLQIRDLICSLVIRKPELEGRERKLSWAWKEMRRVRLDQ